MFKFTKRIAAVIFSISLFSVFSSAAVATVHTLDQAPESRFDGGERGLHLPWIVQIRGDLPLGKCVGAQISQQWILTSRTCIESVNRVDIAKIHYLSDAGEQINSAGWAIDNVLTPKKGNVALVLLKEAKELPQYAPLNFAEIMYPSNANIMGFNSSDIFMQATTIATGSMISTGRYPDNLIIVNAIGNFSMNDLGAPMMLNGGIVGLLATPFHEAGPGSLLYTSIAEYREWIIGKTGLILNMTEP